MLLQVSQVKRAAPITPRAKDIVATVLSHKRRELGPIHEELLKVVVLHLAEQFDAWGIQGWDEGLEFCTTTTIGRDATRYSVNFLDEVLLNDVLHWSLGMHKFPLNLTCLTADGRVKTRQGGGKTKRTSKRKASMAKKIHGYSTYKEDGWGESSRKKKIGCFPRPSSFLYV